MTKTTNFLDPTFETIFFRSWKIKQNPKKLKKNRYVWRACTGEQKSRKSKIGKNDLKHPQTITGAHIKGFWIDSNALTYHMITPINGQNSRSQKSADSRSQNLKINSQQVKLAGCSVPPLPQGYFSARGPGVPEISSSRGPGVPRKSASRGPGVPRITKTSLSLTIVKNS